MISALYGEGVEEARAEEDLGHFSVLGGVNYSLEALDTEIAMQSESGRLMVVDSPMVRWLMSEIRNQTLSMMTFRDLLVGVDNPTGINARLVRSNFVSELLNEETTKAAISVRAGLAFMSLVQNFPVEIGTITQERNENDPRIVHSLPKKLGSFVGKHAVIFDCMLATGGSMENAIDEVMNRGATGVTTVSAFSAPQGLVRVLMHPAVKRVVTAPIEAGLSSRAHIVGSYGKKLGDCGDRYFGAVGD